MPYDHPGIPAPDQASAITAFIVHLSGIVGKDEILDEKALPRLKMPNRDVFVSDRAPT